MPWATAQSVYAILVRHLGLPETSDAERVFCSRVAHRKHFDLRHLGFDGDFWNEGGSPYPRVTCTKTAVYAVIVATVEANGEITRFFRSQAEQGCVA